MQVQGRYLAAARYRQGTAELCGGDSPTASGRVGDGANAGGGRAPTGPARALAGIVHHTGHLRWNGRPVTEPEVFLRPTQVSYVGQLPRVLSGTIAGNFRLGRDVDPAGRCGTVR